jgi:PAS domain S-box-containing protein
MNEPKTVEEYKKYVQTRLDALTPVFARASIGDFSDRLQIPETEDEFTQLYVGIQIVLEVIREQMLDLQRLNHQLAFRIQDLDKEIERRKQTEVFLHAKQVELEQVKTSIEQDKVIDEAMLSSIGDGLVAVNKSGNIMFVNHRAEEMLMEPVGNLIGKYLLNALRVQDEHEKDVPPADRPTTKALEHSIVSRFQGFIIRSDGSKIPVRKTVTPVLLHDQVIGAIEVIHDISKELEVDNMKSEFLSMAAHQLRTPLSTMRWTMELLLSGKSGAYSDQAGIKIERLYEDIKRLIMLVNDLLNVSRIEQGRFPDNPVPTDIGTVIDEVIGQMHAESQKKHVTVYPRIAQANIPQVTVDPQRFAEVIRNLVSNAIKYNVTNGMVTVNAERTQQGVRIRVTDTGIGISSGDLPKVFEKFYRGENAILETKEGTGLGLYVVQSLVQSWGGIVQIASELNKGTTVTITLPGSQGGKSETV